MQDVQQHDVVRIRESRESCKSSESDVEFLRYWALGRDRAAAVRAISARTDELISTTGTGYALSNQDLSGLDLSGFDLRRATLNRAQLHSTKLDHADLSRAALICPGMEKTSLRSAKLDFAYVHALAAQVCNFEGASLKGIVDATGALFHGCSLRGAMFDGSVLSGTLFYQCDLTGTSISRCELQGSTINECYLESTILAHSCVDQLTITKCYLDGVSFAGSRGQALCIQRPTSMNATTFDNAFLPSLRLTGVRGTQISARGLSAPLTDCSECDLEGADFRDADFRHARFVTCNLARANLSGANLVGASIRAVRLDGANLSNVSAENVSMVETSLRGATLDGFRARCAVFRDCDATGAALTNAYLYRSMLTGDPPKSMSLRDADIANANLVQCYIAADLRAANLEGARIAYARFNQSDVSGGNLAGTEPYQASLVKVNMHGVRLTTTEPPFFTDRCQGLESAIEGIPDAQKSDSLKTFVSKMGDLMRCGRSGST